MTWESNNRVWSTRPRRSLSARTHDLVEMMLPESDEQLFAEAYDETAGGDYTLTEVGYDQRGDLDEAMALPLSVVHYADQIPDSRP